MNNLMLNVHLLQFCLFFFFKDIYHYLFYSNADIYFWQNAISCLVLRIVSHFIELHQVYWMFTVLLILIKIFLNAKKSRKFRFFHFRICEKLWESSSMFYWLIYLDIFQDCPWSSKNCSKTNGEKFPITWSLES